jgi:flagellar biosynthetic protein FliP
MLYKKVYFTLLIFLLILLSTEDLHAQVVSLDLGQGMSTGPRVIQMLLIITVLSLAPALLMMLTSFTRIVIVLSFLRNAIGLQQSPPNMVVASLAVFLTFFVMGPTFEEAYNKGLAPYFEEKISEEEAFERTTTPLHSFMLKHVGEKELELFFNMAKVPLPSDQKEIPLRLLIPSFMISELKKAFEIGFLIFLPFLIIDMVVASILMSMGMMMVPPMMISLPFKLIFFVLIDGWHMLVGSLAKGFS